MYISFRKYAIASVDNLLKMYDEENTKKSSLVKCMQICKNFKEYQVGFRKLIEKYFTSNEGIIL